MHPCPQPHHYNMVLLLSQVESFVQDTHVLVQLLHFASDQFGLQEAGNITFVPVIEGPQGRYLYYQYQRYLWRDHTNRFEPHVIEMPKTYGGLRQMSAGLQGKEHDRRRELVGDNDIPLQVLCNARRLCTPQRPAGWFCAVPDLPLPPAFQMRNSKSFPSHSEFSKIFRHVWKLCGRFPST